MKAYSYMRWSSDPQTKGDSLRRQVQTTRSICEKNGWTLGEAIPVDAAVSAYRGDNINKGHLAAFKQAVERGLIETPCVLVVEAMDRVTRIRLREARNLFEEIISLGVNLCTANNEKVYTKESLENPIEIMMSLMELNAAHEYSKSLGKRSREAWERKKQDARNGKLLTKRLPAWVGIPEGSREIKDFYVIEEKAAIVRRIYDEYLAGMGSRTIALNLTKEKIKPFGKCKLWNVSSIFKLLKSQNVTGVYQPLSHDGKVKRSTDGEPIENYYPTIINKDTFNLVQLRMNEKFIHRGPRKNMYNLFTGLTYCSKCGNLMILKTGKITKGKTPYIRLVCTNAFRGGGCKYTTVHYWMLEQSMIASMSRQIKMLVFNSDKGNIQKKQKIKANILEVENKIKTLKKSIDDILNKNGTINIVINEKLNNLQNEKEKLQIELEAKPSDIDDIDMNLLVNATLLKNDRPTRLRLQMAFKLILDKIVIDPEKYCADVYFNQETIKIKQFKLQWFKEKALQGWFLIDGKRSSYLFAHYVVDNLN